MAYKSRIPVSCGSSFDRLSAIMEAPHYILLVISEYLCYVHAEKLIGKQKKITSLGKFEISTQNHFISKRAVKWTVAVPDKWQQDDLEREAGWGFLCAFLELLIPCSAHLLHPEICQEDRES